LICSSSSSRTPCSSVFTRAQQSLRWATVATIDMGRKEWGLLCPFCRQLGPRLIQCGLGRCLLPHPVASSSIRPFGHNRHGPKIGWGECALFSRNSLAIEHKVTWAEAYLHTKCHLSQSTRLATTDISRKLGEGLFPFRVRGTGYPSNTMSHRPRPTSIPSGILIHAAVWPQQTWAENWGSVPLFGEGAGSPSNTKSPGLRPTSIPSGFLMHQAAWQQ